MVLTRRKYAGRGHKRVTKKRLRVGKMRGGTAPTSELTLQLLNTELKSVTTLTDDNKETISRLIDQIPDYIKDGIDEPNLDDTNIIDKLNKYYKALRDNYGKIINKLNPSHPNNSNRKSISSNSANSTHTARNNSKLVAAERHASAEHVEKPATRNEKVVSKHNNTISTMMSGIPTSQMSKNKAINNLINSYKPADNNDQSYFKNNYYALNITKKSLNNRKDLVKSYLKNTKSVDEKNKRQIKLSQQNKKALKNSIPDNLKAKNRLDLIRDINSLRYVAK